MIKSIKILYSTLSVILVGSFVVFSSIISREIQDEKLRVYEVMYKLLNYKEWQGEKLTRDDIVLRTSEGRKRLGALEERRKLGASEDAQLKLMTLPNDAEYRDIGLPLREIPSGRLINTEMRSSVRGSCSILSISEIIEVNVSGYSASYYNNSAALISNPRFTFFDARDCITGYQSEFSGEIVDGDIIYSAEPEEFFMILPEDKLEKINALLPIEELAPKDFGSLQEFTTIYPNSAHSLFVYSDVNFFISANSVRSNILNFARSVTGKRYGTEGLDEAMDDISKIAIKDLSFSGVTAPQDTIAVIIPWFVLAIIWPLYRQMKQVGVSDRSEYWILLDVGNLEGRIGAWVYACAPAMLTIASAIMYFSATETALLLFGLLVKVDHSLYVTASAAPPRGWLSGSTVWQDVGGFIYWLCMWFAICTSVMMLRAVRNAPTCLGTK